MRSRDRQNCMKDGEEEIKIGMQMEVALIWLFRAIPTELQLRWHLTQTE